VLAAGVRCIERKFTVVRVWKTITALRLLLRCYDDTLSVRTGGRNEATEAELL